MKEMQKNIFMITRRGIHEINVKMCSEDDDEVFKENLLQK